MKTPRNQVFTFFVWSWNIDQALELTKNQQPDQHITVDKWFNSMIEKEDCHSIGAIEVNIQYAMTNEVDLFKPVLMVNLDHTIEKDSIEKMGYLVIDGWHRIYKAHKLGEKLLPAILLTQEQENLCRINRFGGGKRKSPKKLKI